MRRYLVAAAVLILVGPAAGAWVGLPPGLLALAGVACGLVGVARHGILPPRPAAPPPEGPELEARLLSKYTFKRQPEPRRPDDDLTDI